MNKFKPGDIVTRTQGCFGSTVQGGIYVVNQVLRDSFRIEGDTDPNWSYDCDCFELVEDLEQKIKFKKSQLLNLEDEIKKLERELEEQNSFRIGDKFKRGSTDEVFMLVTVGYNHQTNNNLVTLVSLKDGNRWIDAVECYVSDFKITKHDFKKVTGATSFVKISN